MSLENLRRARGLKQNELAEMAGVQQSTISKIERGYDGVTLRVMRQLAAALNVDVSDLISDERSDAERALIAAFRRLPADRQQGWLDLAATLVPRDEPGSPARK
ncbi:MAG: helix-turn-helix domain-containing protein [Paracoccus sp. (in: a-proteobacteria)]|uniref:helix-turn-helix domain-containing protein n=1 Tax=Paracoccus sp. TaxID=267 RepID=UPI003918B978